MTDSYNDEWNMSQERVHLENLVYARFNILLIFFSVILAGALAVKNPVSSSILLWVGFIIGSCVAITINRTDRKLDIIMKILYSTEGHPAKRVNDEIKGRSVRRLIGFWIPVLCCVFLLLIAIGVSNKWIKFD